MVYKFQPIILKIIREIIDEKKRKNMAPAFAIEQEVLNKMTRLTLMALDALENDNVIGSHPNMNKRKLYYINDRNGRDLKKKMEGKGGES